MHTRHAAILRLDDFSAMTFERPTAGMLDDKNSKGQPLVSDRKSAGIIIVRVRRKSGIIPPQLSLQGSHVGGFNGKRTPADPTVDPTSTARGTL